MRNKKPAALLKVTSNKCSVSLEFVHLSNEVEVLRSNRNEKGRHPLLGRGHNQSFSWGEGPRGVGRWSGPQPPTHPTGAELFSEALSTSRGLALGEEGGGGETQQASTHQPVHQPAPGEMETSCENFCAPRKV